MSTVDQFCNFVENCPCGFDTHKMDVRDSNVVWIHKMGRRETQMWSWLVERKCVRTLCGLDLHKVWKMLMWLNAWSVRDDREMLMWLGCVSVCSVVSASVPLPPYSISLNTLCHSCIHMHTSSSYPSVTRNSLLTNVAIAQKATLIEEEKSIMYVSKFCPCKP